jgi:preprotein translocase subunit SecA
MTLPALFRSSHPAAGLARIRSALTLLREHSDARLQEHSAQLRAEARARHMEGDFVPRAIAVIAESIRRSHGLEAYDCQLMAGLALADGTVAEMATGEGKTLVALLPAFVFALAGRGAHVATVNPYLARRDAEFARQPFARLGLSVGLLAERVPPCEKRAAYQADVTYGVGTEFGFDYLRDQLSLRTAGRIEPRYHEILLQREPPRPQLIQRGHAFAVIDEADSVLVDEARSPLIISAGEKRPSATPGVYLHADQVASELRLGNDFKRDTESGRFRLTAAGHDTARSLLNDEATAELRRLWTAYVENALHAQHGMKRDVHYIVRDDTVVIVDEFTGRLCPDRSWRDGLHQAVEAHTGATITEENVSEATVTRPTYFRLYEKIAGMTGTAQEAAAELRSSYGLSTAVVPLHRPSRRVLLPDRVFRDRSAKFAALAREVAARHKAGQPILIGSRTIENSEAAVAALATLEIPCVVLNGKQDADEAEVIARAGQPGAVTVATNMAGRGAHIPVHEKSLRAGGLHVIGLERHESARIDRQLIGRAARQGEPGSAQFFLSLDDDLLVRHARDLPEKLAREKSDPEGELAPGLASHFLRVQRSVESADREARRRLAKFDEWLNELKEAL